MKQVKTWTLVTTFLLLLSAQLAGAQEANKKVAREHAKVDANVTESLDQFFALEGARALFDKAAGYAIFQVTKAGLGISGAGGSGVAIDKATGTRTYMKMGSAGAGFTFGASRYDIVILFETADRLAKFTSGGWDSAATAQASAGSQSVVVASTFFNGVAYFQLTNKGLMASADVSGTRFWREE